MAAYFIEFKTYGTGAVVYSGFAATKYLPRADIYPWLVGTPTPTKYTAYVSIEEFGKTSGLIAFFGPATTKAAVPLGLYDTEAGKYAYNWPEIDILANGGSPTPAYYVAVTQITSDDVTLYGLGGTITRPGAATDDSGTAVSVPLDVAQDYVAGVPTVLPTMTTPGSVFAQWVALRSKAEPTMLDRNTVYKAGTNRSVSSSPTCRLKIPSSDVVAGYSWWFYALYKDGSNVAPAFDFNKPLGGSSGLVTVSVLTDGVYVPFTHYTSVTALAATCTAFTANEFDILAAQSTAFYPKNHAATNGDVTLTFRPVTGIVVTGWSFDAACPATPGISTSAQVRTESAAGISGIHVFVAEATDAYGLIVREFDTGETVKAGYAAMPVTGCTVDGVGYESPFEVSRTGATAPAPFCVFEEDTIATAAKSTVPGAVPTILKLLGATQTEQTSQFLSANVQAFGTYPVYCPAYRIAAADIALDFSLTSTLATAATLLTGQQGATALTAAGTFPVANVAMWSDISGKGLAAVFEVAVTLGVGVSEEEVVFTAVGIPNAVAVWAYSSVYSKRIVTITVPIEDIAAGDQAITLRCDPYIVAQTVTPQVCLESSTTAGTFDETVEGVYPIAQSDVFGSLSIGTDYTAGDPFAFVEAAITTVTGYTPHRIEVVVGSTIRAVRYVTGASENFPSGLLVADTNDDVIVRLVVRADVCNPPIAEPLVSALDGGMFVATISNLTDTTSGLWHVGDMARIEVTPAIRTTTMPNIVVYGVTYNGTDVIVSGAASQGDAVQGDIAIDASGTHLFQIAMAGLATLAVTTMDGTPITPTTNPPTLSVTGDSIVVDSTTYYRLGSALVLSIPATYDTKTSILVRHETALVATDFPDTVLGEYSAAVLITLVLHGDDTVTAIYSVGTAHPWVCMAVFDYATTAYVLANRPACGITAVSPAVLGPNVAFTADKPDPEVTPTPEIVPPDADYWTAVSLVAQIKTHVALPSVRTTIVTGGIAYILERYNGAAWVPVILSADGIVLEADTFLRYSRGYPIDQLVSFAITAAVDENGDSLSNRPNISVLVSDVWDYTGQVPFAYSIPKGSFVYLFAFGVTGYEFTEWRYADDSVASTAQGCTIPVGVVDVTVYPVYTALTAGGPDSVMVLNGSSTETEVGLWVSKEYRAQAPWSPSVGVVVRADHTGLCRLIVHNGRSSHILRSDVLAISDDNIFVTIGDDKMRRIPTPAGGMSRFHRVAVWVTGGEVCSIAVATGAQTLKGAH